jgi:hypothetical protein
MKVTSETGDGLIDGKSRRRGRGGGGVERGPRGGGRVGLEGARGPLRAPIPPFFPGAGRGRLLFRARAGSDLWTRDARKCSRSCIDYSIEQSRRMRKATGHAARPRATTYVTWRTLWRFSLQSPVLFSPRSSLLRSLSANYSADDVVPHRDQSRHYLTRNCRRVITRNYGAFL